MSEAPETSVVDIAALMSLDRAGLAERWAEAFGCPAPQRCESTLLRAAVAWHAQMQALRKSAGTREVRRMVRSLTQTAPRALSPGARLLREWRGRTHHVTVLASGFEYEGRTYRSLTAVARRITGTPWSGPLFFGLRT
jgi:hypothetical protein